MKIANIDREILNDLRNFNEIFRKDVPCDNIKSHKKPRFQPLFRRYIYGKTTGGGGGCQIDSPPSFLGLKPYIDMNTKLRTEAKSDFEKDFFCFWKTWKYKKAQRY